MTIIREIRLVDLCHKFDASRAYGASMGLTSLRQSGIVMLELDDGIIGYGEAWGPTKVSAAYLDVVQGYLIGTNIFEHEHAFDRILSRYYHLGIQNQMMALLSGIDVAVRDAIAKKLGVPLHALIGGAAEKTVPVYAAGGYMTPDGDAGFERQMDLITGRGYKAAKIKIGYSPTSDEWRARKAREILGDDIELLVDCNASYTVDIALESMRRIEKYRIGWYEEALPPLDFRGYSELRARAPMPIATGEALYTVHDFKRLADVRGADIFQPDLTLCGGIGQGRRIADLVRLEHLRISPHVWGSAVGLATACHFVASLSRYPNRDNAPYPTLVEYDVGENPLRDNLLKKPIRIIDGALEVPEGVGLGIELDEAMLDKFSV